MDSMNWLSLLDTLVALQSLTGKYRGLQGNPCNENRDPAMRTGLHYLYYILNIMDFVHYSSTNLRQGP